MLILLRMQMDSFRKKMLALRWNGLVRRKKDCRAIDIKCLISFFCQLVKKEKENYHPKFGFQFFSFLPCNDLIEASAVCKLFYELSGKNSGYIEKLSHSGQLFNNSRIVFTRYEDVCLSFSGQLFYSLMQYVREEDCFFLMPKILSWLDLFIVYCIFVFGTKYFTV